MHMRDSSNPVPLRDFPNTEWLKDALSPFVMHSVDSIVPSGFEAYVRILHPALMPHESEIREVRWSEVARMSGRVIHVGSQWPLLSGGQWTGQAPSQGRLSDAVLDALIPILAFATNTKHSCWFCLWDGYGYLYPGSVAPLLTSNNPSKSPLPRLLNRAFRVARTDAALSDLDDFPRLEFPQRNYFVFHGSVGDARAVGAGLGPPLSTMREGPNLWWPDDRSWVVGSPLDLESSYVACDHKLAQAILDCDEIEAFVCYPSDSVTYDSDNGP